MDTRIKIVWDGDAPGLQEHRLSVSAFGKPLYLFLTAIRRIASNMIVEAVGKEGSDKGRLAAEASLIDIQIEGIEGGSLGVVAQCKMLPKTQPPLMEDLSIRAGQHLLDTLQKESKGQLANIAVRKYLTSLPKGVTKQTYGLYLGNEVISSIEIGSVDIAEIPESLPQLMGYRGEIIGVGFEPGRSEVKIRTSDETVVTLSATTEQVEGSLRLRSTDVYVMGIRTNKRLRVLQIRESETGNGAIKPEVEEKYLFTRWDALLKRLAE